MESIALNPPWQRALRAWERYPLVFAAGVIGTIAALVLNHLPAGLTRASAGNLVMTAWTGVPFLFALAEGARVRRWPTWAGLSAQGAGLFVLWGYLHLLASSPWPVRISRFWLCLAAAHLFVSLSGSFGLGATPDAFWRYNRRLAARLAAALGYGALVYLGLGLGLMAVKILFELDFPDTWFLDPGILALGIFNTWFFLAGVPGESREPAYPRQLRLLVRLILLPLVCAYFAIVYAYAVRMLMAGRWPAGWTTWLLFCCCGLALLCLFLAQPLAASGGDRWLGVYCRHFHVAMAPVALLLFVAIGKRVQAYGLTENRYLVLALAVWLAGILLHAAMEAPRDLRILPASLCLVALLAAFGPWGAFEVSRRSQEGRLRELLAAHGMLSEGKLAKAPGRVPRLAIREIGGIAGYLEERGRLSDLRPWIPVLEDSGQSQAVAWRKALTDRYSLLEALELPYLPAESVGPGREDAVAFRCRGLSAPLRKVSGFDYLLADFRGGVEARDDGADAIGDGAGEDAGGFAFAYDSATGILRLNAGDVPGPALDLGAYFGKLRDRYPDAFDLNLPPEEMRLAAEDARFKVLAHLRSLAGEADGERARLEGFAADLFVELKSGPRLRARSAYVPPDPPPAEGSD